MHRRASGPESRARRRVISDQVHRLVLTRPRWLPLTMVRLEVEAFAILTGAIAMG